jgi:hypothetical protein
LKGAVEIHFGRLVEQSLDSMGESRQAQLEGARQKRAMFRKMTRKSLRNWLSNQKSGLRIANQE